MILIPYSYSFTTTFIFFILIPLKVSMLLTVRTKPPWAAGCAAGQHACNNSQCIPLKYLCDGDFDCDDHSDEMADCPPKPCGEGHIICLLTGRCLPLRYRCDLEYDCGVNELGVLDTSDEDPMICNLTKVCRTGEHRCASGDQCVHLSRFCDGHKDCADGSDENSLCGTTPSADDAKCKYGGAMTLDKGLQCYCPEGQVPVESNCLDEDECSATKQGSVPVCSQRCVNLVSQRPGERGYRCDCASGFELINETWCRVIVNESTADWPSVVVYGSLKLVHKKLNSLKGEPIGIMQVPEIQAMAADQHNKRLCWIPVRVGNAAVSYVSCIDIGAKGFQGTVSKIYVSYAAEGVSAMSFDWIGHNWYMADSLYSRIFACCSNFTHCITLSGGKIEKPSAIAVDSLAGYAFITDWGAETGGLWRLSLDGAELFSLVDSGIIHPLGLAVDVFTRTVYWADRYLEVLSAVDYNKNYRKRELATGNTAKGIVDMFHFERWLYAASGHSISQLDVLSDSSQKPKIDEGSGALMTKLEKIVLLHEQAQPQEEHPCMHSNGACDQLCLVAYLDTNSPNFRNTSNGVAKCACAEGYRLVDSHLCIQSSENDGPVLIFGRTRPGSIAALTLSAITLSNATSFGGHFESERKLRVVPDGIRPVMHLRRPTAIAVDASRKRMYFSDARNYTVQRREIHGERVEEVLDNGLNNCEGLAIDWTAGNLYLSDQGLLHIVVVKVAQPALRKVIIRGNLSNPRAIAVHPAKGYLFFADWIDSPTTNSPYVKAKIERSKMDGDQRKSLIIRDIHWPNGLAIDYANEWLYWCDAYYDRIERIRYNGADRQVILHGRALNHPYGLAVYKSFVFWSEFLESQINRLKVNDSGAVGEPVTVFRDYSPLFELHIYDSNLSLPKSPCAEENGGCTQFCFATGCKGSVGCEPVKCLCADGFQVDPNNPKSCIAEEHTESASRCGALEFECKRNRKCISQSYLCDGDDDCGDGTDEDAQTCADFECPYAEQFKCKSNQCIEKNWICDGEADCAGGDDEDDLLCKDKPLCSSRKRFLCAKTKRCLPLSARCDGEYDCGDEDFSDEEGCEDEGRGSCGAGQFQCLNGKCVPWSYVCDGTNDCRDGSDEHSCHEGCLAGLEFRCSDGLPCISSELLCDGVADCEDGHDESNKTCPRPLKHRPCASINQFKCVTSDQCIRSSFRCDGQKDCIDGSDEIDCKNITCKTPNEYQCENSQKCIPMKFRCDGHPDCDDGSDERDCSAKSVRNADRCLSPLFLCANDPRNTCLQPESVCDGTVDCPMGDDEGFLCGEKMCVKSSCEHNCHERPSGYVCSCKPGYVLAADKRSCIKKQPCSFGTCSQLCWVQGSTSYCHCEPGFELMPDKFTCKSTDSDSPRIIFTNRHEIRILSLKHGASSFPLVSHLRNSIAIDYFYDKPNDLWLFWTDIAADIVYRGRLKGQVLKDVKPIISYGIWTAEGIAVDWMAKNIYWVDSWLDQIEVSNFDGTMRATVMRDNMKNLRALTLDPSKGLMFWTDWEESNPRIERATMAGNNRKILFEVLEIVNGGWPNGLTCDFLVERIYWIDAKSDSIHTITYDGNDHREIIRDSAHLAHPFAIAIFGNYVYWTDWRVTAIVRANKWNGSDLRIVEGTSIQPFDMKIIHRSRQPRGTKNPCRENNGGCTHICLIDSPISRVCACPHMMVLDEDTRSCLAVNTTLITATRTAIRAYDARRNDVTVFPVIAGKDIQNILAIAVDYNNTAVFWSDDTKNAITKVYLNGSGGEKVVVWKEISNCDGLAVDSEAGVLYFTSWFSNGKYASISVTDIDGLYRRTIVNSIETPSLKKPEGLVLDIEHGRMYWLDRGYQPIALFWALMSGENVTRMEFGKDENCTQNASSLAIDPELGILFWTQPHRSVVRAIALRYNLNMVHELTLPKQEAESTSQIAISLIGHELFYYDWATKSVVARQITLEKQSGEIAWLRWSAARSFAVNTSALVALTVLEKGMLSKTTGVVQRCKLEFPLCLRASPSSVKPLCSAAYEFKAENNVHCTGLQKLLIYTEERSGLKAVALQRDRIDDRVSMLSISPLLPPKPAILAIDPIREKLQLYVVDSERNELWKSNLDSTAAQLLLDGGASKISSVAIDLVTGNLYVAYRPTMQSRDGVVELLSPVDVMIRLTILKEVGSVPRCIAIDPTDGYLFWINGKEGIRRSRLDGTSARTIVNIKNITVLSLDSLQKRVCYFSNVAGELNCCDYSGQNNRAVGPKLNGQVSALTVYKDSVFLASGMNDAWNISELQLNGSIIKRRKKVSARIIDLAVLDGTTDPKANPCADNNGGCAQICFSMGNGRVQCACSFSKLSVDGRTCEPHDSFIAFSRGRLIEFVPWQGTASDSGGGAAFRPIQKENLIRNAVALTADKERSLLFFSDIHFKRIQAVAYDGSVHLTVVENIGSVEGLAFDMRHRDLYFTSLSERSIMRVPVTDLDPSNYPKKATQILHLSKSDNPRGIAVDPCSMTIYFTNWRDDMPSIDKVYFSGYGRERIITEDIRTPNAVIIDFKARKLYWSDAQLDKIERCDFDGTHREIVLQGSDSSAAGKPSHPFGLYLLGDRLFFTDWIHRALIAVNKFSGGEVHIVRANFTEQPMGIVAVDDSFSEQCDLDACRTSGLNCEDECRLDAHGNAHCVCRTGRRLNPDNITCSGEFVSMCALNEWSCSKIGRCIKYEETCDMVKDCPNGEDEDADFCATRACRDGFFSCGNGLCIPEKKKCNKVNDCKNYQDEVDCECSEDEFKCQSGMCVPLSVRCDYKMDCNDASDEINCSRRNCTEVQTFGQSMINCEHTTQCILAAWFCDGSNDCWDGWDEEKCPATHKSAHLSPSVVINRKCGQYQHRCNSTGTCIPLTWVCDDHRDCADSSDEAFCHKACNPEEEHTCTSSGKCLNKRWVCDGNDDCGDGSDELNCDGHCDAKHHFMCRNGNCIPIEWRCDGTDDCMDGSQNSPSSDEIGCDESLMMMLRSCKQSEFTCNGTGRGAVQCIPRRHFCDGERDCDDGSDEPASCGRRQCTDWQFRCGSGQCIPRNWTCNEILDCSDGTDETAALCGDPSRGQCGAEMFQCASGICIDAALVCNTKNDCGDSSDEPSTCNLDECSDSPCEDRCIELPISYRCECKPPRVISKYDNRSCVFKNECDDFPCSQICLSKGDAAFECSCEPGYRLAPDRRTCRHSDSIEPELLLINRHFIRLYSLSGSPKGALLTNLSNGVAVDYDILSQLVYWTDVTHTGSTIGYTSLSKQGGRYKALHGLFGGSPDGLAVDWLGRNIYWCDKDGDSISVADLKGLYRHILLKGDPLQEPRAIVLDPLESALFWSDWGDRPHIGRMDMDGANRRLIVTTSLKWPNALAADVTTKRIFWGDGHLDYIGSADYDGRNRRTVILKAIRHVFGLTVFEDFLYWTDWSNRTVERAHKISGQLRKVILNFTHYRPMGIKVVHPLIQMAASGQHLKHPCQKPGRCDNLCLLSTNEEGYTCACAQGFRSEGKKCKADCKPSDFICRNTYKCLPFWWQCDGQDDCGDMEDERFGVKGACPQFQCELGQMACKSDMTNQSAVCISPQAICDGKKDCPLGDDERKELCDSYQCIEGQYKCVNSSKCIPLTAVCDGVDDCGNGDDEKQCAQRNCLETEFRCSSGRCLPLSWKCDGQIDCNGGDDEKDCADDCEEDQFMCANSSRCIAKSWICDGEQDCEDGSDEANCGDDIVTESDCDSEHFRCADGQLCLPLSSKCDGIADCQDYSDEIGCRNCQNGTFPCSKLSSTCILPSQICDRSIDCEDASDELYCSCSSNEEYDAGSFHCFDANLSLAGELSSSYCIPKKWVCDGIPNCPNGLDEDPRVCAIHNCGDSHLKCKNNICYPQSGFCDGIADCADESDEKNAYCTGNKTCRNAFRCLTTGRCIPYSQQCDGNDDCGDASDELGCDVRNLCDVFGSCSQECLSKKPLIKCVCAPGYSREYWHRDQCKAAGDKITEVTIMDANIMHQIRHVHNASSSASVKTVQLIRPIIDFDFVVDDSDTTSNNRQHLTYFWIDSTYHIKSGALIEMLSLPVKSRGKRQVTSKFLSKRWLPIIAVDWINKNIYQVESNTAADIGDVMITINTFTQLGLKNSSLPIIWGALSTVTALVVAPNRLALFWAVQKPYPAIETAMLDGLSRRTLILTGIYEPTSITVDEPNNRLYWADVEKGTIESITLSGRDRRVVRKYGYQGGILHDRPLVVDVFEDVLYVIGSPNGTAWKTHKFGRLDDRPIEGVMVLSLHPKLHVVHPAKRYPLKSVCFSGTQTSKCGTQPCVPSRSGTSYSCLCPPGSVYSTKSNVCVPLKKDKNIQAACGSSYCFNGGVCSDDTTHCICPKGLRGRQCETDICYNHCLNGGNCTVIYDSAVSYGKPDCSCPLEYTGSRCQQYKCTGRCGAHGTCAISTKLGLPVCECDPGYSGPECDQAVDPCTSFCFNGGRCYYADSTAPFCHCPDGFMGRRCENCILDSGQIQICRNDGHCKSRKGCVCPPGFNGTKCENDLCAGYCQNGGICKPVGTNREKQMVRCSCVRGFNGERCEDDWCHQNGDYCLNRGHCIHDNVRGPLCVCTSKFQGERCNEKRDCEDYCLNESECQSLNDFEWSCRCKPGYSGKRCDLFGKCSTQCENGAKCRLDEQLGAVCDCPRGLSGKRCEQMNAKSCSEMECMNGGRCMTQAGQGIRCSCPVGWSGMVCAVPECHGYCLNNGICSVIDARAICTCTNIWMGDRCQFPRSALQLPKFSRQKLLAELAIVVVPVIVTVSVLIGLLYLIIVKKASISNQFVHRRMIDRPDENMDEFHNPAFMAGGLEDISAIPNESTNFTNPMYESVYNDTVSAQCQQNYATEDSGLLPQQA